jgi:catechol 2,3-dioxygenase-like lactoylglutathione lyase family enzyme
VQETRDFVDQQGRAIVASKGPAAGRIEGINHLVLIVRSMDDSLPFYRDILGLRVAKSVGPFELPDGRVIGRNYFLEMGHATFLGLVEYSDAALPRQSIWPSALNNRTSRALWPGQTDSPEDPEKFDHVAFDVPSMKDLEFFRGWLSSNGVAVSDVVDYEEPSGARFVKSIYFFDPSDNPLEISTFDKPDPGWEENLGRDLWFQDPNPPSALFE